jgi:hypothetical protein
MAGERVSIIDPATQAVISEVEIDRDGNVLASVPANKPYDLRIEGTGDVIPGEDRTVDGLASSHLSIALYDAAGQRLPPGVEVTIKRAGVEQRYVTGPGGDIAPLADHGAYEVCVAGETFSASSLRVIDLQHAGAAPYQFQLKPDDAELDYSPLERGRAQRVTASDLGDD